MFFPNDSETARVESRVIRGSGAGTRDNHRGTISKGNTGRMNIAVSLRKPQCLWVRKPTWLDRDGIGITQNGQAIESRRVGSWAVTPILKANERIEITFPLVRRHEQEWVYHELYRIVYEGDTIVAMSPGGRYAPMYPEEA